MNAKETRKITEEARCRINNEQAKLRRERYKSEKKRLEAREIAKIAYTKERIKSIQYEIDETAKKGKHSCWYADPFVRSGYILDKEKIIRHFEAAGYKVKQEARMLQKSSYREISCGEDMEVTTWHENTSGLLISW